MKRLAIFGASGHGKVVADTAELCGWSQIVFFDDAWPRVNSLHPWPVVGNFADLICRIHEFSGIIVAIGNNRIRYSKILDLIARDAPLVTLIHPNAIVSRYAQLDAGTVAFAGVAVNAGAVVGCGTILNTGCTIDHDCYLGEAVHISPGANLAGGVVAGDRSWIGIGASVRQLVKIGQDVIVGAGAAVICDLPDNVTAVGVPARVLA